MSSGVCEVGPFRGAWRVASLHDMLTEGSRDKSHQRRDAKGMLLKWRIFFFANSARELLKIGLSY